VWRCSLKTGNEGIEGTAHDHDAMPIRTYNRSPHDTHIHSLYIFNPIEILRIYKSSNTRSYNATETEKAGGTQQSRHISEKRLAHLYPTKLCTLNQLCFMMQVEYVRILQADSVIENPDTFQTLTLRVG
jgi:hypothetical protein